MVAPVTEYFPATQLSQAVLMPAAALNLPAAQSMQVLVKAAPTVAEYFPAAQFKQVLAVVEPCISEYVPAGQELQ